MIFADGCRSGLGTASCARQRTPVQQPSFFSKKLNFSLFRITLWFSSFGLKISKFSSFIIFLRSSLQQLLLVLLFNFLSLLAGKIFIQIPPFFCLGTPPCHPLKDSQVFSFIGRLTIFKVVWWDYPLTRKHSFYQMTGNSNAQSRTFMFHVLIKFW